MNRRRFIGGLTTAWLLDARLPHVGIVVGTAPQIGVVHNIGRGAEQTPMHEFSLQRAVAHYRWPASS
jgi:uncharacterized protein YijF (DUF1287 family)